MKITKTVLRKIIKEEMGQVISDDEGYALDNLIANLVKDGIIQGEQDFKTAITYLQGAIETLAAGQYRYQDW